MFVPFAAWLAGNALGFSGYWNLFDRAPEATVIWTHAGAYPYPPPLRDYLRRYPGLYIDLSVRDQRAAPDG
jgi:hypothetical protein